MPLASPTAGASSGMRAPQAWHAWHVPCATPELALDLPATQTCVRALADASPAPPDSRLRAIDATASARLAGGRQDDSIMSATWLAPIARPWPALWSNSALTVLDHASSLDTGITGGYTLTVAVTPPLTQTLSRCNASASLLSSPCTVDGTAGLATWLAMPNAFSMLSMPSYTLESISTPSLPQPPLV